MALRSSSIFVAVTVMPGSVDGGACGAGSVCAEAEAIPANTPPTDIKPHTRRIGGLSPLPLDQESNVIV
jgi:hypothetical protein